MQAWKSRPDMAKTRFRNLFRGAKLSSRRPEPKQATQSSPPAKAEQRQLFAEPASVAEAEVPARASEPVPTVPDAPPSGAQTETPTKPEPAVERTVGEYASEAVQLRESGRLEQAEALLSEAIERFPAEPRPRLEWALLAHARRRLAGSRPALGARSRRVSERRGSI